MTIFRFALIRSLRNKFTLLALCGIPFILIFMRPLWVPAYNTGAIFYGMILMYASFLLVRSVMTDRTTGTVTRIFAAPVTTYQYLAQNLLAYELLLMIQVFIMITLGTFLYQWRFVFSLQLFLCYTIFAGTSISFALAWNSLFRSKQSSDAVFSIIVTLMAILGGIFVPITLLPPVLQKIGMLFPTYWLSNAILALEGQLQTGAYLLSIAALCLFTCIFLVFGSKRRLS